MNPGWIAAGIAAAAMVANALITWATIKVTVNGHTARLNEQDGKLDKLVTDVAVLESKVEDLREGG